MRQSFLFWVLALPVLAFGQPIEGPYVVLGGEEGVFLNNPHVCMFGDSLSDIFFLQHAGDVVTVCRARFDLASHELASGLDSLLQQQMGWTSSITNVQKQFDGIWAMAIFSHFGWREYLALILIGNEDAVATTELAHVYCDDPENPYSCSWIQDLGITRRIEDGWIAGWILGATMGPYYEPGFFPYLTFFGGSGSEDSVEVRSQSFLYGPTGVRAISLSPDSVLVLLSQVEDYGWIVGSAMEIMSRFEDPSVQREVVLACTHNNLDFRRTHAGRLLVFSGTHEYPEYPHPRIVEVDTTGNCIELCTLPLDHDPDAIAWHPDYGFAALLMHPTLIVLARVDTSGVEVQPLGVFWEATQGYRIAEANLVIANDGRVVVLWTELDESNAVVMKIGAVGWDTFLGVEKDQAKPVPERISLSAYPNPFNMTTTISFELARTGEIHIRIYDVMGREVGRLIEGMRPAGHHELRYDASGLASGIYFVRLTAGDLTVTKKLMLLK
jgi:hypothetical protein